MQIDNDTKNEIIPMLLHVTYNSFILVEPLKALFCTFSVSIPYFSKRFIQGMIASLFRIDRRLTTPFCMSHYMKPVYQEFYVLQQESPDCVKWVQITTPVISDILKTIDVPTMSKSKCQKMYICVGNTHVNISEKLTTIPQGLQQQLLRQSYQRIC